jgi:hypothetical protein
LDLYGSMVVLVLPKLIIKGPNLIDFLLHI